MSSTAHRRRSGSGRRLGVARRAVVYAVGFLLATAPLLIGGAPAWAVVATLAVAGVVGLLAAAGGTPGTPLALGPLGWALAAAVAWTALQAAPLPCGLVENLHPEAADAAIRTAELFDRDPVCTISLDPGATREEVLKSLLMLVVFGAAATAARLQGREAVLRAVAIAIGLCALVAMAHVVVDAEAIYGHYAPRYGSRVIGPFVNPNHLGGLLALGLPIAVGLAVRDARRRAVWISLAVLVLATIIVSLSRGAILASVVGLGAFAWLRFRRGRAAVAGGLLALPVLAMGVVLGAYAALEPLLRELEGQDTSKLSLIARAGEAALTAPWMGVGRGAFSVAFVAIAGAQPRYEYAESFLPQWCLEWGVPFGLAFAGVLVARVGGAIRSARDAHAAGAAAGAIAYLAHNVVDFGIEMAGSAPLFYATLAVLESGQSVDAPRSPTPRWPAFAIPAIALGATLTLGASVVSGRTDVQRDEIEHLLTSRDHVPLADRVAEATRDHPSEPVFLLLAGADAVGRGDPGALRLLGRAMHLAPGWPAPHALTARYLLQTGRRDQALLEVRETATRDLRQGLEAMCSVSAASPSAHSILRATPPPPLDRPFLELAIDCVGEEHAAVVAEGLLEARPELVGPRIRLAGGLMTRGDLAAGGNIIERLVVDAPEDPRVHWLRAEIAMRGGHPDVAIDAYAAAGRYGDMRRATTGRARALAASGRMEEARDAVGELRGMSSGNATGIAEAEVVLGDIEEARGNAARALHAYEEAFRLAPRPDALEGVLRTTTTLGDRARHGSALNVLCARWPERPQCSQEPRR